MGELLEGGGRDPYDGDARLQRPFDGNADLAGGATGEECRQDHSGGKGGTDVADRNTGNSRPQSACCDQAVKNCPVRNSPEAVCDRMHTNADDKHLTAIMRKGIVVLVAVIQSVLLAAHFFVYETWIYFWEPTGSGWMGKRAAAVLLLAVSFVAASLLSFKYWNSVTRIFYRVSAIWLGLFNFLFLASVGTWLTAAARWALGAHWSNRVMVGAWFAAAVLAAAWGLINASVTRVRRVKISLPNLPLAWQGRTAAMISGLRLGRGRGANFARNIVARIRQLRPAIVFLAGDLYDGGFADLNALAGPLRGLNTPLGNYFVAGNHEQMRDSGAHLQAAKDAGLRLLNNEKVVVEGMQIIGVHYHEASNPARLHAGLKNAG